MRWLDGEVIEQRCPLCGAPGDKPVRLEVESPFPGRGVLRLLDCQACTSQFFDDQSLPPEYYEDSYAAVKFYVEQGAGIDHMIEPLLRVPDGRVSTLAEIGCGFGFALDFARSALGWRVKGIDRGRHARAGARLLGLDIVPAYFDGPESLEGRSFDSVFASEVLEHVPDPSRFVRSIAEILTPSGIAIFTTPNVAVVHRGQPVGHLLRTLSPGFHLVLFSVDSLRAVLEQAGFTHILIEEDADSLIAYASRAPLELRELGTWSDQLYRRYLRLRGGDPELDGDLRLGLRYRHFKAMVNAGEWPEAEAEFVSLRSMVLDRYGFDLSKPETLPTIEPLSLDRILDLVQARSYINQFVSLVPANIVSLLYFRGTVALHTGRPREALDFFRAAGRIGVVARSLQHTLANDGETEDLFKRSFLMSVLALADVEPDTALIELTRVVDGAPPPGVPSPLWAFDAEDRRWLLGMTFVRLVERGFTDAAARAFDRLRDQCLAECAVDPILPGSSSEDRCDSAPESLDGSRRVTLPAGPHPAGWARIFCARGLLDLNTGHSSRALRALRLATELAEASAGEEAKDVRARSLKLGVLALVDVAPCEALAELDRLLDRGERGEQRPRGALSPEDEEWLLGTAFVRLVDRGAVDAAGRAFDRLRDRWRAEGLELLVPSASNQDERGSGGESVGAAALAAALRRRRHPVGWPGVLCARGLLDVNTGRAERALVYLRLAGDLLAEEVDLDHEPAEADSAQAALYLRIRSCEVLALCETDRAEALRRVRELLDGTRPPGADPRLWRDDAPHRGELLFGLFVSLVNRGDYAVAAELAPEVDVALDASAVPESGRSLIGGDQPLDATFCRAMLALNHEEQPRRAAEGFRRAFEAARQRVTAGTASAATVELLWAARYHEALSLLGAGDRDAARAIAERMAEGSLEGLPQVPDPLVAAARQLLASEPGPASVGSDAPAEPNL